MMNQVLLKRELSASANEEKKDQLVIDPAAIPDEVMARFDSDKLFGWKESTVRAIAFAESRRAKILGVSGITEGVGSSSIAASIAKTYSDYGQRILLIDANEADISEYSEAPKTKLLNLTHSATPISRHLHYLDLARIEFTLPQWADYFRSAFQIALEYYHIIVVDLPPVVSGTGRPAAPNLAMGPTCDSILMVCEPGRTTRAQIQQGLASSRISGMKIEGILLNDYRLPMNRLLSRF
jgi:Mrp family chromosome partitioning ATPase